MKKFDHYVSNLQILSRADQEDLSNEFIIGGIIDKFFVQFELAWKVLKVLLQYEGRNECESGSPRTIIKVAYSIYDFIDEDVWLGMLRARNDLAHVYDAEAAVRLTKQIISEYIPAFQALEKGIVCRYKDELEQL